MEYSDSLAGINIIQTLDSRALNLVELYHMGHTSMYMHSVARVKSLISLRCTFFFPRFAPAEDHCVHPLKF